MKFLLFALLAVAGAVGLALLAQEDPGYVLLAWSDWTVETSLSLLVVVLVLGFALLYAGIRLLLGGIHLPGRMAHWSRQRRTARARRSTQQGMIALAEGNWKKAERLLNRDALDSELPLINYLGAARAAQKLGADDRRDDYLSRAHRSMPEAELAVGLTQAEVQLSSGQTEHALATLMHLRSVAPRHTYVLYLLKRLYERLGDWTSIHDLLPELRRQKALDESAADALEQRAHFELLGAAAASGDLAALRTRWEAVPKRMRGGTLLATFATALDRAGESNEAERLLRDAIKQSWDPALVRLYGMVRGNDAEKQLLAAESWLANHERQPDLLLTLGRLSLRNQLWGKARAYFEASIGSEPRPETYCELGHLLNRLGEPDQARDCFRGGLELAAGSGCTAMAAEKMPARAPVGA